MTAWPLFLAFACGPKKGASTDPSALLDEVRGRALPFALQARYSVRLDSDGVNGTTRGAMILHQPDRFRLEIYSPVGPPLFLSASDGTALHVWTQKGNAFLRGDDAVAVLEQVAGGAVGVPDLLALLTGTLPLADAEVVELRETETGEVHVVLAGPNDSEVRAVLDPHTATVAGLTVVRADAVLAEVEYTDVVRVGRHRLPEEISVRVPALNLDVALDVDSWDELGKIPDAFELTPPPGSTESSLVDTLQAMAEARGLSVPEVEPPAEPEVEPPSEPEVEPPAGPEVEPPAEPEVEPPAGPSE